MKSKTIIISSQNKGQNGRGILSILQEEDMLKFRLRLYNLNKLSRYCKLAIYHQSQVYSANMLEKNGVYESSMVGDFDIDKDFYSAIIDTENNNNVLLAGGTYSGYFFNEDNDNVFKNIEKENLNTEIYSHNETPCDTDCDRCANCKYKEYFYSQKEQENNSNFVIENKETENTNILNDNENKYDEQSAKNNDKEEKTKSVIQAIIPQFKYVFENYNADETLNKLLPNGRFVKINENNENYSIGAIYDNDEMKYICYAIMCNYNTPAPQELGEHYQWLPLDKEDPLSEGYYIVFQDAKDLKILEL